MPSLQVHSKSEAVAKALRKQAHLVTSYGSGGNCDVSILSRLGRREEIRSVTVERWFQGYQQRELAERRGAPLPRVLGGIRTMRGGLPANRPAPRFYFGFTWMIAIIPASSWSRI
jgi:hypothetical protein